MARKLDLGFFLMIIGVMTSAFCMLIYCYTGTAMTNSFFKLAEHAYHSKWYEHDSKSKEYFILIIANGQRAQIFVGLKMIYLSLATFSKVNSYACFLFHKNLVVYFILFYLFENQLMNTAVSFYLMFKGFSSLLKWTWDSASWFENFIKSKLFKHISHLKIPAQICFRSFVVVAEKQCFKINENLFFLGIAWCDIISHVFPPEGPKKVISLLNLTNSTEATHLHIKTYF